jgi:mono/diheme cytochrome c family protein
MALAAHGPHEWHVPDAAKKMKNPVAVSPAVLKTAKAVYSEFCEQCHGASGKGDGVEAVMYTVKPSNFADAKMMSAMSDGEIFYKITEGRQPMPSFKMQLTDEQRWQLVHYIRTFVPKPAGNSPSKAPAKKPVASATSAKPPK